MKKESGVVKWFGRLQEYGYINPEDGGDDNLVPQSTIDDGGLEKPQKVELDLTDQGDGPQTKNTTPRSE